MATDFSFRQVAGSKNALIDIIFIHGLTGDPEKTWMDSQGKEFWPEWYLEHFPDSAIHTLGYPASLFKKWADREMDIFERARSALDYMVARGLGKRPLIFVTHSLGGLLTKQILRTSLDSTNDKDLENVARNTELVVFLASPHTGAKLASIMDWFFGKLSSDHMAFLKDENGVLYDLNNFYRQFSERSKKLNTVVYYEKYKTKKAALVVGRDSSDPGVTGTIPIAADKDHLSICKADDKNDQVYVGLLRHIRKVYERPKSDNSESTFFFDPGENASFLV